MGKLMQDSLIMHKANKDLVGIERKHIDPNNIQAFILDVSSHLVLLQYVYDFRLDGLMILRVSDISDIRCSKTEEFQLGLLKDEKLYDTIDFNISYDMTDWKTAISSLARDFDYFILENEKSKKRIFLIGKISTITSRSVHLNYFSGAGNRDKKPSVINYKDITACQVDTNYINVYKRRFERIS